MLARAACLIWLVTHPGLSRACFQTLSTPRRRRQRKRGFIADEHTWAVFAAPLVLFLPEEAAQQLRHQEVRLDQWGVEYLMRAPNALEPLLESALRCRGCTAKQAFPRALCRAFLCSCCLALCLCIRMSCLALTELAESTVSVQQVA